MSAGSRIRASHNFWRSEVFEPLDDVVADVPAAFTFGIGNERWAAFDCFAFHRHVDLDVLACGGDADVPEPRLDHTSTICDEGEASRRRKTYVKRQRTPDSEATDSAARLHITPGST